MDVIVELIKWIKKTVTHTLGNRYTYDFKKNLFAGTLWLSPPTS